MALAASVANKGFTVRLESQLSCLDATLTKNRGVGLPVMVNYASDEDVYPERGQRVEGPLQISDKKSVLPAPTLERDSQ